MGEARVGLRLGRSNEELLFRDVRKTRLDLVVELAYAFEVDLERLATLVILLLFLQASLHGTLGPQDSVAYGIEGCLLFRGKNACLGPFVPDQAFDCLL